MGPLCVASGVPRVAIMREGGARARPGGGKGHGMKHACGAVFPLASASARSFCSLSRAFCFIRSLMVFCRVLRHTFRCCSDCSLS